MLRVLQLFKDVLSAVGWGVQAFAADLERLYTGFSSLDAEVVVTASRSGEAMAASLNLDDAQINRLLLQVRALPLGLLPTTATNDHSLQFAWHVSVYWERCALTVAAMLSHNECAS